ncbi:MAG: hypothetical protein O7B35_00465 [Deltaproteobacteria bacterium]|nr:hypothetical protein [Deltaproteobacteria bacterium]
MKGFFEYLKETLKGLLNLGEGKLRKELNSQARSLSEEALNAKGSVSKEQMEQLERLARLAEISAVSRPRRIGLVVMVFLFALVIVTLLLVNHLEEAEIELNLVVSEFGFVSPVEQVLTNSTNLAVLGVSGLSEVQLPQACRQAAASSYPVSDVSVRLATVSDGERPGVITLAPVVIFADTRLRLRHTEISKQYRLSLLTDSLELQTHIDGGIKVNVTGTRPEQLNCSFPRSVTLRSDSQWVDLDLTFPDTSPHAFSPQLSANNLSFFRIDEFMDPDRTLIRRVSTILSGTLYLESLNGKEYPLRPGETIVFEESTGQIRTLQVYGGVILLRFRGRVHGMSLGTGASQRNLMPTYLEWLSVHHGLELLWGTVISVFSLIFLTLRFWGGFS